MAFGKNGDPRYRGNFRVLVSLFLLGAIAAGVLGALFWFRERKGPEQVPVVSAKAVDPAAANRPEPSIPTPLPEEVAKHEKLRDLRKKISESRETVDIAEMAQEILELEPEDSQAWNWIGQAREMEGDEHGAMAAYERSVASPSRTYYAYFLKGRFQRKQGDLAAAIASLEEARRLKTDSIILSNLIMIYRLQAGRVEEVRSQVKTYQQSELDSNVDQWLFGAAALALQDGNEERALTFSRRFRNLVNPEVYTILISDSFFDQYRERVPEIFSVSQ